MRCWLPLVLVGCGSEAATVELDVVVSENGVVIYAAGDLSCDTQGGSRTFATPGTCVAEPDFFTSCGPQLHSCLTDITVDGRAARIETGPSGLSFPFEIAGPITDASTLIVHGCVELDTTISAADLPQPTNTMSRLDESGAITVSWSSDIPSETALLHVQGFSGGELCHVRGSPYRFAQAPTGEMLTIQPLLAPDTLLDGHVRVWRGGRVTVGL